MLIRCHHCKHVWNYTGKRLLYTGCPNCHYNVNIEKDRMKEKDKSIFQCSISDNTVNHVNNDKNLNSVPKGIPIICSKCGHFWVYHGNLNIARCSNCNSRIYIK